MKKITLLFALLLSIVSGTAVAQTTLYSLGDEVTTTDGLSAGDLIIFKHNATGAYLYASSTSAAIYGQTNSNSSPTFTSTSVFKVAASSDTEGAYTFESLANEGYYIPVVGYGGTPDYAVSTTAEPYTLASYTDSKGFIIKATNTYGSYTNVGYFDMVASTYKFVGWQGSGDNCYYHIYKATEGGTVPTVSISNTTTYTVAANGSRGYLSYDAAVASDGITSTGVEGATADLEESNKEFAFLTSAADNVYMYSPTANKFVTTSGSTADLSVSPGTTISLTENVSNSTDHPYLLILNYSGGSKYISISNGFTDSHGIIFWNDAADAGSQFLLTQTSTEQDYSAALARIELYEALAAATAPSSMNFGTGYGQYTDAGNYTSAYTTAQALLSNADATTDQLTSAKTALSTALNAMTFNIPQDGDFLRIKAHNSGTTYLAGENSETQTTRAAYKSATDDPTGTVFYYNDGKLYNLSNGYPIANTATSGNAFAGYNGITTGVSIEFGKQTAVTSGDPGLYYVKFAGSRYLYAQDNNYSDAGGGMNNVRYTFDLEEVTTLPIQITSAGYATLNLPVAVTVPDGVTVYYLNGEGENSVKIEAQSITTIPANTPVLIAGTEGTHNFAIATEAEAAEDATTGLTGVTIATTIDAATSAYVLANKTTYGVGFYPLSTDNRGLKGFRAYYVPTNSASAGFAFQFGETTAIDAAIADALSGNAPIYDLSGRKVTKAVKGGLYIQNGKKVIK